MNSVDANLIYRVKTSISIPLIVGGGIDSVDKLAEVAAESPDLIVIGNALEQDPLLLMQLSETLAKHNRNRSAVTEQSSS